MRSLSIVVAWLAATAVAVGVSWLGVRTVVHDAVLTPPQLAVPASPVPTGTPPPTPPATSVPPTTTSAVRPTTTTPPATSTTVPTTEKAVPTTVNPNVHSYSVQGGQVVLSLTDTEATLVSATPADGYSVQVWQETGWLRVDFSSSGGTSSVFATWNGHAPSVQTYES